MMVDELLKAEIDAAVASVSEGTAEAVVKLTEMKRYVTGRTPFRMYKGIGAAWNFTAGPAYCYQGPSSIDEINYLPEPVVLFADYIPEDELKKIEVTRVRGIVIEAGSIIDPTFWWFVDQNRASMVACIGVLQDVRHGEYVIVDGVRGCVYLTPDAETHLNYERLRYFGPPQKDLLFWEALRQLTTVIAGNRRARMIEPPYDFLEQHKLLGLAKRARKGEIIADEDNEWLQNLLSEGMPTPDEMKEKLKGDGKREARPERALPDKAGRAEDKDDEAVDAAPKAASASKQEAAKDEAAPDPFAGLDGAALRRAKRKAVMEERRKRRGS
jgi:hypothetical protein